MGFEKLLETSKSSDEEEGVDARDVVNRRRVLGGGLNGELL